MSTSSWESLPIADKQTFFFIFLHAPYMSLSYAWWKRYFFMIFKCFWSFLIVFDHANACACWLKYTTLNRCWIEVLRTLYWILGQICWSGMDLYSPFQAETIIILLFCSIIWVYLNSNLFHCRTYHNVMYKGDLLTAPLKWYLCSTLTFPPCEKSLIKNFGINFGGLKNSEDLKKSNSFVF